MMLLQQEESTIQDFELYLSTNHMEVNMKSDGRPLPLANYIEVWRIWIWKHVFLSMFRGNDCFVKTKAFREQIDTDNVIKRVIYR